VTPQVAHGRISSAITRIRPSATMTIDQQAKAMQRAGTEVFNLSAGELDFPTPTHIVDAARAAAETPAAHHYTPTAGLASLRDTIAAHTQATAHVPLDASHVLVTNGGKQAVFQSLAVLVEPGDEVLLPVPYWTTYPEAVRLTGGTPVPVAAASKTLRVTASDLEAARTPHSRVLVLCSPNNPTGAVHTRTELEEIGAWAVRHGIWIISDEMYSSLIYSPAEHVSILDAYPHAADTTILISALSKSHAMTGWRVGWMVAPADIITAASTLQSHLSSHVNNIAQHAGLAALTGDQSATARMRNRLQARRDLLLDVLSDVEGVTAHAPDGAFYVFVDVRDWLDAHPVIGTSQTLAERLLQHEHTAAVPGEAFGAPGHLRLSFAGDDTHIRTGAERLVRYLSHPHDRSTR